MKTVLALALCTVIRSASPPGPVAGFGVRGEQVPAALQSSRAQRVARDAAGLMAFIAHEEEHGIGPEFLQVVRKALGSMGDSDFAPSTVGGVKRKELEFLDYWNAEQPDRDGAIPALDFENPRQLPTMLRACRKELAQLGIELLVVPVPLRLQVYPEHLQGFGEPPGFGGYGAGVFRTLEYLTEGGVQVLDLLPVFVAHKHTDRADTDERLYLDYDIHWTPRAEILAADLIAQRIKESDWFTPGPFQAGEDFHVRHEKGAWTAPRNKRRELEAAQGPVEVWYERILTATETPAHRSDKRSEFLIVGDSFTGIYQPEGADIASLLFARLGYQMDLISVPGGGQALWKSLGRRGKDGLRGKRVVIWLTSVFGFKGDFEPTPLFGQ